MTVWQTIHVLSKKKWLSSGILTFKSLKFCQAPPLFVGLWRRVWLQKPVENISCVLRVRSEYIKHSPRSGEYGALWIMTVRQTNHFLFDIALSFPVSSRFWMPLIPFLKNELSPPKTLQSSFKLKKSSKSATILIFFSSESWDVALFKFYIGRTPFSEFWFWTPS